MASTGSLFDTPEPAEAPEPEPQSKAKPDAEAEARPEPSDAAAPWFVVRMALDLPLRREFDYRAPQRLRDRLVPGARAKVPFGRRRMIGFVVAVDVAPEVAPNKLKEIEAALDPPGRPALPESIIELAGWVASYYATSWGEALRAALPLDVTASKDEARADGVASRRKRWSAEAWVTLTEAGVATEAACRPADAPRPDPEPPPPPPGRRPSPAGCRVLDRLANAGGGLRLGEVMGLADASRASVRTLLERELLTVTERRHDDPDVPPDAEGETPPVAGVGSARFSLTDEQAAALATIVEPLDAGRFGVVLLHGITGSGKTEVYLRAIEQALASGRTAIVLVPEIVLTPPLQRTLRARFASAGVAIIHSRQSAKARTDAWERARTGRARVVVGARSAVWAPIPDVGLIVVDEEHEPSYKQEQTPRYHGRDVAIVRAKRAGAVCVLASATPALETLHNARAGKYTAAALTRRATGALLPEVDVVDLRVEAAERRGAPAIFSRRLESLLADTIDRGERAILFLNRRGHSTALHCPRCGVLVKCPHCDIALAWHRRAEAAICHYCYHRATIGERCPECIEGQIQHVGAGTERLEAAIEAVFPNAGVLRLDTDAIRSGVDVEAVLDRFRSGPHHVLVGTQMVAKGLDFEDVTLVGVTNADTALGLPDFRAAERTFQLLTQVAGRAGRGKRPGRTVLQTYSPDHFAVERAAKHDYEGFVKTELEHRRVLRYPPFARLVRVVIRAGKRETADRAAGLVAGAVRRSLEGSGAAVLGPAPCPRAFLNRQWRVHVLVKTDGVGPARATAEAAHASAQAKGFPRNAVVTIDVDPLSLL